MLKLSNPADLIETIPRLFGYHMRRSVVLIALKGPRSRLGMQMRLDLAAMSDLSQVRRSVAVLEREGAEKAIVLIYTDAAGQVEGPPEREVFELVANELAALGIEIREALCVHEDRWWSYLCADPLCCPRDGTPIIPAAEPGGPARVAAAAALEGLVALPSREALAATIKPVGFLARASMDSALDRVADELAERVRGAGDREVCIEALQALREEGLRLVAELLERFDGVAGQLNDEEAARVLLLLEDVHFRDGCIEQVTAHAGEAAVELWSELVRRANPLDSAPVATVLAFAAWQAGHGTLANIAVDRALACNPDYRLAVYLSSALTHSLNPRVLRDCVVSQHGSG